VSISLFNFVGEFASEVKAPTQHILCTRSIVLCVYDKDEQKHKIRYPILSHFDLSFIFIVLPLHLDDIRTRVKIIKI